jgi:hypothetical protein
MPFTLAHRAAVVPVRKLSPAFLLSPLVIGTALQALGRNR